MVRRSSLSGASLMGWTALAALLVVLAAPLQAQPAAPPLAQPGDSRDLDEMPDIGLDWPDLEAPSQPLPADPPETVQEEMPPVPDPATK